MVSNENSVVMGEGGWVRWQPWLRLGVWSQHTDTISETRRTSSVGFCTENGESGAAVSPDLSSQWLICLASHAMFVGFPHANYSKLILFFVQKCNVQQKVTMEGHSCVSSQIDIVQSPSFNHSYLWLRKFTTPNYSILIHLSRALI